MKVAFSKFVAVAAFFALGAMASAGTNVYVRCQTYDGAFVPAANAGSTARPGWLEVSNFSFDILQTLNIGSQSSGAGAGKVTFNPLSVTLLPGSLDGKFFGMAASGTPFKTVEVEVDNATNTVEVFVLGLVAVKTQSWSVTSDQLKTTLTFEYSGLLLMVPNAGQAVQRPTSVTGWALPVVGGWNRVRNVKISSVAEVAAIQ